jgi:uncharacterized lipoprotein YajG
MRLILGLALCTTSVIGCAFGAETVTLPPAVGSSLSGGDGRSVVVVVPFEDERAIRHRCGMKKNGYNMDTADLNCSEAPALWIADLIVDQLRAAGFQVSTDSLQQGGGLRVEGSLHKIFVEPLIGFSSVTYETDLHVQLTATSASGLEARRSFFVKARRGGMVATVGQANESMQQAAEKMANDVVAAIISLMNRYPELSQLGITVEAA